MTPDWPALDRLRTAFLDGTAGRQDYWQRASDLASYDATFAQRIGWKWDYVLAELEQRGWRPPPEVTLLDWGCGSGIAARAFLDWHGARAVRAAWFWDRSPLAMRWAAQAARDKYPGLEVSEGRPQPPGLVLLSHVLAELNESETDVLIEGLAGAASVLWVEPGTAEASRGLIAVRERLRATWAVVAPCSHAEACGLLAPGNERHWCHHFAASPPAVFTDPFWGRFAQMTGVDLRSLPLSFLVLDRRAATPLPPGTVRVLGRPRVYKAHAVVQVCEADGVTECELHRRHLPAAFRELRKGLCPALPIWEREGHRVVAVRSAPRGPESL